MRRRRQSVFAISSVSTGSALRARPDRAASRRALQRHDGSLSDPARVGIRRPDRRSGVGIPHQLRHPVVRRVRAGRFSRGARAEVLVGSIQAHHSRVRCGSPGRAAPHRSARAAPAHAHPLLAESLVRDPRGLPWILGGAAYPLRAAGGAGLEAFTEDRRLVRGRRAADGQRHVQAPGTRPLHRPARRFSRGSMVAGHARAFRVLAGRTRYGGRYDVYSDCGCRRVGARARRQLSVGLCDDVGRVEWGTRDLAFRSIFLHGRDWDKPGTSPFRTCPGC